MKVQKKLPMLVTLIVLISLLIFSAIVSYFAAASTLKAERSTLTVSSESMAGYFSSYFNTQMDNLKYAAEIPVYRQRLTDLSDPQLDQSCNQVLDITVNTNATLTTGLLLDSSGIVVNASDLSKIGEDYSDSNMVRALLKDQSESYCSIRITDDGSKALSMAVPIFNQENTIIGILNRTVSLKSIDQYVSQLKMSENTGICIIDENAQPLSSPNHEKTYIGYHFSEIENLDPQLHDFLSEIEHHTLSTDNGFFSFNIDNESYLAHYSQIPNSGWVVLSAATRSSIFSNVAAMQLILLATTFSIALLALLLGLRVSKTFTKPLNYLTDKIRAIGKEDFSVRCSLPGDDEFHDLAESINKMTASLESSQHELIKTNDLLKKSARFDPLTTLPNLKSFQYHLDQLFMRHHNQALLLLDIRSLKTINDTFGHYIGDAVLIAVGNILKNMTTDTVYAARLNSDEFIVFVSNYTTPHDVLFLAEQLLSNIRNIRTLKNQPVDVRADMGITFLKDRETTQDEWVLHAYTALHMARVQPHNHDYYIFDPSKDL